MVNRKRSKLYKPEDFSVLNLPLGKVEIENELLRYGLDSPHQLKKFSSLKGADDYVINFHRNDDSLDGESFAKRGRGLTFAATGKREILATVVQSSLDFE